MIDKIPSTQTAKDLFCVERDKHAYTELTQWDLRE